MSENQVKGETHGCIVCGKPYQIYAVYDSAGRFVDMRVMSMDAKAVKYARRPLVACESHSDEQVKAAVNRAYGPQKQDD